jgi:hypothetical protein
VGPIWGRSKETKEGWPLLTVETEVDRDSNSTNERVLPWLVRWARRASTKDFCLALAALVSQLQNIIFLPLHFFTLLVPIIQQPGAGWRGGSPVCVSGHKLGWDM